MGSQKEPSTTLVVVDDDAEIGAVIEAYFGPRQLRVRSARGSAGLWKLLEDGDPALVILDLGLATEDGIDVARELRARSDVPLIILSGRGDTIDKVLALEIGADDYVTKPFELAELHARVRSLLRRMRTATGAGARETATGPCLCFDQFRFYVQQRRLVDGGGVWIDLTAGELRLLEIFLKHPNRMLSRDQIMNWSHGRETGPFDRSVDMQVGRLRRKIEPDPSHPSLICTLRGGGYWFAASVSSCG